MPSSTVSDASPAITAATTTTPAEAAPEPATTPLRRRPQAHRTTTAPAPPLGPELRLALLQARQAEASDVHRLRAVPDGLRVNVPEQHLQARFDAQGAELTSDQGAKMQARFTLTSLGRGSGTRQHVKAAEPVASKHTVAWERPVGAGRVQESWQAGPLGLEHRVLVRQRPAGEGTVELEVSVAGLTAEEDGEDVKLTSASGSLRMHAYFVRDARGKLLPGRMKVRGGSVVYAYEDTGAVYPVEVDPLVVTQQSKLLAEDKWSSDHFGWSVALSGDGNTALIGAEEKPELGAAYVFIRTAGIWTQQTKLVPANKPPGAFGWSFGWSVALSSDGDTALVSGQRTEFSDEAACVFTRTAGVWTQQQQLNIADEVGFNSFGWSVALSGDGHTALIGSYGASDGVLKNNGAAYVFTRTAGVWTQQTKLLAADKAAEDRLGHSVALSSDGNTALVGAHNKSDGATNYNGAAYIFTRTADVWTQQQKLLAADKGSYDFFGCSVALAGDGHTALIGAYMESDGVTNSNGAAYVFTRTADVWTQQQKLLAADKANGDFFGHSVALSSSGNIALIGASWDSDGAMFNGAAYVFLRASEVWAQQQKLLAADKQSHDRFGQSVALSGDGNTALVGASMEDDGNLNNGATYIFTLTQLGQACASNAECPSGFCTDGVCCNTDCAGGTSDCQACSVAAGAAVDGACGPTTGNACSDGNGCTQSDTCQEGVCQAGNEVPCTPGECQQGGSCDAASGGCQFSNQPDGTPCSTGLCQDGNCIDASGAGGAGGASGTAGAAGTAEESGAGGEAGSAGQAGGDSGASGTAGTNTGGSAAGDSSTAGTAGATSTGGSAGNGSAVGKGGMAGNDGATGQAGSADKGGASGQGTGGQTDGGALRKNAALEAEGGCGCRTTGGGREGGAAAPGLLALALAARRRSAGGLAAPVRASWSRWPGADRAARRR